MRQRATPERKPSFRSRTLSRSMAFEIVQLSKVFRLSRFTEEETFCEVISLGRDCGVPGTILVGSFKNPLPPYHTMPGATNHIPAGRYFSTKTQVDCSAGGGF